MKVIDLFAGIGGFSLAAHWAGFETTCFVEKDEFCQQVLRKNFLGIPIYGDINEFSYERFITDTEGNARNGQNEKQPTKTGKQAQSLLGECIVTGGFPCQPFSQAGKREGTEDERHLWPQMFRVIQEFRPAWVIAENVRGILSIGNGLVFETCCTDLESEGYEVQPFIIPACAKDAPHRRDRVWIIANRAEPGLSSGEQSQRQSAQKENGAGLEYRAKHKNSDATNASGKRQPRQGEQGRSGNSAKDENGQKHRIKHGDQFERNWLEVAAELCRVDDGIPAGVDGITGISAKPKNKKAAGRQHRLKSLGNAIVPQIAYEFFNIIKRETKK